MSSFLSTSFYNFENSLLPNDCIVISNLGEDQEMHGEGLGVGEGQQGTSKAGGGPIHISLESISESRSSLPYIGGLGHIRSPFLTIHMWLES